MATVKAKYRPSAQEGREGTIYYQVIHKRVARQINTGYHVFKEEWDSEKHKVITTSTANSGRGIALVSIRADMDRDMRLDVIIAKLESGDKEFSADYVVSKFQDSTNEQSFFRFMEETIVRLKQLGKARISETYTLNSFRRFLQSRVSDVNGNGSNRNRDEADILLDGMDSDTMVA